MSEAPINYCTYGSRGSQNNVMILGGVHGDEQEGIDTAMRFESKISNISFSPFKNLLVTVIPCLNNDGRRLGIRSNARNVDLNRNLPTSNWRRDATNSRYEPGEAPASEVETQFFLRLINETKPKLIVSVHSFTETLLLFPSNPVNIPFRDPVQAMANALGIPIVDKMNYEVFGSLSRFGFENNIATLTIELIKHANLDNQIERCADEIVTLLRWCDESYIHST